jgi:hypothetical protein
MSLDRRVQLLLDRQQYHQVELEAARSGQSVAGVIREAIESRLASGAVRRAAAAERLLASADPESEPGEDWEHAKAAHDAALRAKLP